LFNLRHSQLRNVIERILGTLKRPFAILQTPPEYPLPIQAKLVIGLVGLPNFIRKYSSATLSGVDSLQVSQTLLNMEGDLSDELIHGMIYFL